MSIKASNNVFPHDPDDNFNGKLDRGGYEGTAQDLKNEINALEKPDGVLIRGEVVKAGNVLSIAPLAFTCRIDQVELTNVDEFETTIAAATDNYHRIDIGVFTKFGTIVKIQGIEGLDAAQKPDVPADTIEIFFTSVFGSVIGEAVTPPEITDLFVKKTERQKVIISENVSSFTLIDERHFVEFTNPAQSTFDYFVQSETYVSGQNHPFRIRNNTGQTFTLNHLTPSGSSIPGETILFFQNGENFEIKDKEIIEFVYDTDNNRYEYFGVITDLSDYYTKSQVDSANTAILLSANAYTDSKVSGAYIFKGNKANYADLVATGEQVNGFVYNLLDTEKNYAWNGTAWDDIGGTFDISGKEDVSNKTQDIEGNKTSTIKYSSVKQLYDWTVGKFMDLTTSQDVTGVKTFRNGMIALRNVANTFSITFTNAITAARSVTWPDKSGTIAMTSDIVAQLSGTVNRLVKFGTTTTGTNSRIEDTGTFLGIGTTNTPTKDITLGNQSNRSIGIEESDNTTPGRDFIRTAGRTINYASSDFVALNITSRNVEDYETFGTDMYAITNSAQLLKQTNSTGDFVVTGSIPALSWRFVIDSAFNFYTAGWGANNLYKQSGPSGTPTIIQTFGSRIIALALNGNDLYVFTQSDIYIQTNLTGSFVALGQSLSDSTNNANACASPTGNVYYIVQNVLYKRTASTGLFVNTGIAANGVHVTPNNNVYISSGNKIYKQINEAGAFIDLNQVSRVYFMLGGNAIGNVYCNVKNSDTYLQQNYAVGIPNLDGGTLKDIAGTGKGIGKSHIDRYTGQKTVSGTDMQIETLRERIDENGFYMYYTHPIYANDAAADADSNLPSKAYYKIIGNRGIFQKP